LISTTQSSIKQILEANKQTTVQQAFEKFNQQPLVQRILREYKEAQKILSEIQSNSG
jgi:hypothetical protein